MDNFLQRMEGITLDDVATFARKMLASRPTMVSWGDGMRLLLLSS
jgi:mitochondrial-processing peptidase subunit alpha